MEEGLRRTMATISSSHPLSGTMEIDNSPQVGHFDQMVVREKQQDVGARPARQSKFYHFARGLRQWLPNIGAPVAVLAVLMTSFSDIIVAVVSTSLNSIQVSLLYSLGMFISSVSCTLIYSIRDEALLKRRYSIREWFFLLPCSAFDAVALMLFIASVRLIPVGDATSVFRTMPVFSAIFGRIFLRQEIRYIDFVFIVFCIAGVTLIARPSFIFQGAVTSTNNDDVESELIGISFALISAICFALGYTLGTKLLESRIRSTIIASVNSSVFLLVVSGVWLFTRRWDCCPGHVIFLCIAAGCVSGCALIMIFWSFTRERLVVVSVVLATNVIFNNVLQVLVMKIIPHWLSGLGSLFILTACVGMAVRRSEPLDDVSLQSETRPL